MDLSIIGEILKYLFNKFKRFFTSPQADSEIEEAFQLALNDYMPNGASFSDRLRLQRAKDEYLKNPSAYKTPNTDTQKFIDCFKKRLSEQLAAHNYLMTLRADEQARSEERNILEHRKTHEQLERIMSRSQGVGIKPEELRTLLTELPLKEGQVATDLSLEEMLRTKRIPSEEVKQLLAEFVQFFFEYTDNLTEEIKRLRATGDNYLAETLEDIKRVLAGESKRSLTAIYEEFKEREQQKEIKVLKELIKAAQLEFSFKEACGFYERLLELAPTAEYHFNYALLLQNLNEFDQARSHYEEALQIYRDFWKKHPEAYKPHVAMTLNNLGNLLSDIGELKKAQTHYEEALKIHRELAEKNPEVYKPYVATTLNNLGVLLRDIGELKKAQTHYEEALNIYIELAEKNPQAYKSYVAMTLNNLGNLLQNLGELKKAQTHYEEALNIYRELADKNPQAYLPDVATTLNNLGVLLSDLGELKKAQTHYEEALKTYRELTEKNPQAYNPDVAMTLNNLGVLLKNLGELKEAQTHYEEALKIRLQLADKNPQAYNPYVATTQQNLAILYRDLGMKEKAEEAYQEARSIRQDLANLNPTAYEIDYAKILVTGIVSLGRPKEELEEAKAILLKYPEHPKAQELLKIIDKRLKEQ